jgi:hypothetical protein
MGLSNVDAGNVFLATVDAPAYDPTQAVTNELAVCTLPLADPETCIRRLREHGAQPKLIVTDEASAPALAQVLAETAIFVEPMAAVVTVNLPRLATRLLAGIANSEAQASGVPNAVVLADASVNFLLSEVLVTSVQNLDEPVPSLMQTARSMFPGGQFVITSGAESGVGAVSTRHLPEGFTPLACCGTDELPEWMSQQLTATASEAMLSRLPAWDGVTLFGNAKWAEFVSWNVSVVRRWSSYARSRSFDACHWCDQPLVRDVCAFCGYDPQNSAQNAPTAESVAASQGGQQ